MISLLSKLIFFILKQPTKSILRKNHLNAKIGVFCDFYIEKDMNTISFGKNIVFKNNCSIIVKKTGTLKIENNVFFNNQCSINCLNQIEIGENTLFGESVKIYDHNHAYNETKIKHKEFNTAPIKIGKNCWIGSNCIILKGVTIGDNVILGAGCVIHKDIPSNSIIINKQEHLVKNI